MVKTFRFEIEAAIDTQTFPRLIGYFAQRGLTPSFVQLDTEGVKARIAIVQSSLEPAQAELMAERMRSDTC